MQHMTTLPIQIIKQKYADDIYIYIGHSYLYIITE